MKLPGKVPRILQRLPKCWVFFSTQLALLGNQPGKTSSEQCHLPSWLPKGFKLESWAKLLEKMQIPFLVFEISGSSMPFIKHRVESRGAGTRDLFHHRFCVTLDRCLQFKKGWWKQMLYLGFPSPSWNSARARQCLPMSLRAKSQVLQGPMQLT